MQFNAFKSCVSKQLFANICRQNAFLIPDVSRNFCAAAVANASLSFNALVKELRQMSGAPIKDCKKAIAESDGNVENAVDWLRIQGIATAKQKSSQIALNGFICAVIDSSRRSASLVEVNTETDFAEQNKVFQRSVLNIANTIAMHASVAEQMQLLDSIQDLNVIPFAFAEEMNGDAIEYQALLNSDNQTIADVFTDIMASIRENLVLRRAYKMCATDRGLICNYMHGRTTAQLAMKGALIRLETDSEMPLDCDSEMYQTLIQLGNDIATHTVANTPQAKCILKSELDANAIEKERRVLLEQALEEGNSNLEIAQKKVDGRMKKYYSDNVLLEQVYCLEEHDNKFTINKMLTQRSKEVGLNVSVADMAVYNLGDSESENRPAALNILPL